MKRGYIRRALGEWFQKVRAKGREGLTVMFVPHSQKKIKSLRISYFSIVLFIIIVIIVSALSFSFFTGTSIKRGELIQINNRQNYFKYQLCIFQEELTNFLGTTNYRSDLHSLFVKRNIIKTNESILALGGAEDETNIGGTNSDAVIDLYQMHYLIDELRESREHLDEIKSYLEHRKTFLNNVPNIWPLASQSGVIIEHAEEERAIYIESLPSTPVRATAEGVVSSIVYDGEKGVYRVRIDHKFEFTTIYHGMAKVDVSLKKKVKKGDVIGYTDGSGLERKLFRYQISIAGTKVAPTDYISSKY